MPIAIKTRMIDDEPYCKVHDLHCVLHENLLLRRELKELKQTIERLRDLCGDLVGAVEATKDVL